MSQVKRFLTALLALVLLIGSGTAQDGGTQYDLYLFKGDTTRDVVWTQAYVMEASIAEHYGSLLDALFELMPTSDPGRMFTIGDGLAQCDDLMYEFWAAVGRKNALVQTIIDSIPDVLFDTSGMPTDAYYVLLNRQKEIANMEKVMDMVLKLLTRYGCPLPSESL
ncbi:MAG: hypothetical protein KF813_08985 [Trueperaceae bacterium]|nr:hypothetical protein [Trueperaceae bacterium]